MGGSIVGRIAFWSALIILAPLWVTTLIVVVPQLCWLPLALFATLGLVRRRAVGEVEAGLDRLEQYANTPASRWGN